MALNPKRAKGHGGAPRGNQNAAKGSMWRNAVLRALERRTASRTDGLQELDALADRLLTLVAAGEITAIKELGDRLDGRPHQRIELEHREMPLEEMEDGELERIAAGSRTRASKPPKSETEPPSFH